MTFEGKFQKVGLAIFGVGRAGQVHLGSILRLRRAHLRYIVEEILELGQAVANQNVVDEDVKIIRTTDAEQVFNDDSVHAIVICTPTNLHEDLVRRGLRSGKAVFCEKPIAESEEKIKSCYEEAQKFKKPLLCGFNRRHDPSVIAMRSRVLRGEIGQVQCIKTCSRDSILPSAQYCKFSGGIFHDMAVHDIDFICWVLGEFPVSVFAQAHAFHKEIADQNDVDQVMIVMKFPSGCIASMDLNRENVFGYDQRYEIFGDKGMLEMQNRGPTTVVQHTESGALKEPIHIDFPQRYRESYEREMAHFLNVVLGVEKDIAVKKEETMQVCRIASACSESYRTGQQVFLENFRK